MPWNFYKYELNKPLLLIKLPSFRYSIIVMENWLILVHMTLLPSSLRKYRQGKKTSTGCHCYISAPIHCCTWMHLTLWGLPQFPHTRAAPLPHRIASPCSTPGRYCSNCLLRLLTAGSLSHCQACCKFSHHLLVTTPFLCCPDGENSLTWLPMHALPVPLSLSSLELTSFSLLSLPLPQNNLSVSSGTNQGGCFHDQCSLLLILGFQLPSTQLIAASFQAILLSFWNINSLSLFQASWLFSLGLIFWFLFHL